MGSGKWMCFVLAGTRVVFAGLSGRRSRNADSVDGPYSGSQQTRQVPNPDTGRFRRVSLPHGYFI